MEETIDYGEVSFRDAGSGREITRRFAISAGLGYDAEICHAIDNSRAKHVLNAVGLGKLIYLFKGTARLLTSILLVYAGKHFIFRQVHHLCCRSMSLKCSSARYLHTDGDARYKTDALTVRARTGLHLVY